MPTAPLPVWGRSLINNKEFFKSIADTSANVDKSWPDLRDRGILDDLSADIVEGQDERLSFLVCGVTLCLSVPFLLGSPRLLDWQSTSSAWISFDVFKTRLARNTVKLSSRSSAQRDMLAKPSLSSGAHSSRCRPLKMQSW